MSEHVVPIRIYLTIFATLMVLTFLTVYVATVDLGALNTPIAIGIAVTKAVLVILYFMHVRYSSGLTQVAVVAGVLCLLVLIGITMADVMTRGWLSVPGGR